MNNKTKKLLVTTILISTFLLQLPAKVYYLSPDGKDSNQGTFDQPFGTLAKAISMLEAGDTCYVRGGTYYPTGRVFVTQTGTKDARICLFAYEDEKPIFNWENGPQTCESDGRGIEHSIGANYWHYKGLEICYAGDNGMKMEGSFCVIEQCVFHHNRDTGLQLGFGKDNSGNNTRNPEFIYGRYNIIVNCDSYENYDILPGKTSGGGGNADGFAIKLFPGPGNEFHGCRSWRNSDDGWDFYHTTFPIVVHNCWTMNNGYDKGNGNGFKMGGYTGQPSFGAHIFMNCVSTDNPKKGFDQNNHNEGCYMFNCISARNEANYQFDSKQSKFTGKWVLRNCIGSQAVGRNHKFLDDESTYDIAYCSWNIFDNNNTGSDGNNRIKTDYSPEFESLAYEDAIAPRQENGELPLKFARLKEGSKLIDQGTPITDFFCESYSNDKYNSTISIPFLGTAPDLGAFEYGQDNNEYVLVMPENDGSVDEEEPGLSEWKDEDGNSYTEKVYFDWYNFQETTLPETITHDAGSSIETDYTRYDSSTINSPGALHLKDKGVSYMQLELPSLRDLQVKTYATGSRVITVKYKKEGESGWSTSKTYSLSSGSHQVSLVANDIKTKKPISIQVINSRTDGGSLRISDLFVSGYEKVEEPKPDQLQEYDNGKVIFDMYQTETYLIVYGEIVSLELISMNGKVLKTSQNTQVINTNNLSKGVYLVNIKDKSGRTATQKFIKK